MAPADVSTTAEPSLALRFFALDAVEGNNKRAEREKIQHSAYQAPGTRHQAPGVKKESHRIVDCSPSDSTLLRHTPQIETIIPDPDPDPILIAILLRVNTKDFLVTFM
jgi:hypothetical protein